MTTFSTALRSLMLAALAMVLTAGPAAAAPIPGLTDGQTVLLIVGALVVIMSVIGGYLIYSGVKNRNLARASELWPTAGGKVLATEVTKRSYRDHKRNTTTYFYKPHVRYAYSVGGAAYEGEIIRFGDVEKGHVSLAEEVVGKYPVGSVVAVRYDPQDPTRATLETESAGGGQIWTGIFFIAVPLIIAIGTALLMFFMDEQKASLPPEVLEQLNKTN